MAMRKNFLLGSQSPIPTRLFRLLLNLYPPYWATGIVVEKISADWREIVVRMKLRWYNRNAKNTHFGGSIYAMTDPFFMLMLIRNLGSDYVVWDKSAFVEFVKPGKGTLTARFVLDATAMADIQANTAQGARYLPEFTVEVIDTHGETVARVVKTLYVRKKPATSLRGVQI